MSELKKLRIGSRVRIDEVKLECTVTEFRMTEVVAVDDSGFEFRIDPQDFLKGVARVLEVPEKPDEV